MSKIYYEIKKELLKQLNETTVDSPASTPSDLDADEKQALNKKILELANNSAYIKPILALVVKYLKTQTKEKELAQFQQTAMKLVGSQKKQPFSTLLAVWMAFRSKPELANEWNTFISQTPEALVKQQKGLLNNEDLWNSVEGQIYFIFDLYGKLDKRAEFRSTGEFNDTVKQAARAAVVFSNTKVAQTRFHLTILDTLKKLLGRVGQKDPDTKTPALNFQAAYIPILSRFQSTIEKLTAKNEKELKEPGAANKPELKNNLLFLTAAEEAVEAIRNYISMKKADPPPTVTENVEDPDLEQNPNAPKQTDFIGSYGSTGDFEKLKKALEKMEKFVPGVSTFFGDMESTDLDEITRSKQLQQQLQKAVRSTLSTIGREVDNFSGKGRFSISGEELKKLLNDNGVKANIEPIINNAVRAYKDLSGKISSKQTIKDFLEVIVKNSSKYATKTKTEPDLDIAELPENQKITKIALEVIEGKHFEKIKRTVTSGADQPSYVDFYEENKKQIRNSLALFYDKGSTQKEFVEKIGNRILHLKKEEETGEGNNPTVIEYLKFLPGGKSLVVALEKNDINTFITDLNEKRDLYKQMLEQELVLDFTGDERVGIESGTSKIRMFKFFNKKIDGYDDPETVSPINFIIEMLDKYQRPYGEAVVKFQNQDPAFIDKFKKLSYQTNITPTPSDNKIVITDIEASKAHKIEINKWINRLAKDLEQYYEEKEKMDDLFELFLKLYEEENIDPNDRKDIIALGVVFDRNFQVESFQEVSLQSKVELLKRLLEKTLPGLDIQNLAPAGNDVFKVKAKHSGILWNSLQKIKDGGMNLGRFDITDEEFRTGPLLDFNIDFTETETDKVKEKQENTLGKLWDYLRDLIDFIEQNDVDLEEGSQLMWSRREQDLTVAENLTSKLETLINEFINKRKQQWQKRTM